MNIRQLLLNAGINSFGLDLVAESFLKSPIAAQALASGDPLKISLPIDRSDCAEWVGVEITIAGVPKLSTPAPPEAGPYGRAVILSAPQGWGKPLYAKKHRQKMYGCTATINEWSPGDPIIPNAMHLTHTHPEAIKAPHGVPVIRKGWKGDESWN